MEFPTYLLLITLLLSGFAILWASKLSKWYKLIHVDEQRYRGILTTPERFIEKVHTTATDPLPVHGKASPLIEAADSLDLIYLGSGTSEEAIQRELSPMRVYIDESRVILFTIEQAGDLFIATMNTYFEDGFWLQTAYPYAICLQDNSYEINGLKTSFEQAYAFHQDTLNGHLDEHGQPKLVTHLEASLDLMNEQMIADHPRIIQVGLKHFKRLVWAQFAIWIYLVFMLITLAWPAVLFGQFLYSPYSLILPFILVAIFAVIWERSSIFTTAEIRKKKKHGSHPFEDA
ncbi:MAG: hypothetical protein CL607_00280 [Anaerolineaceae bacterium]|nr:hypothetical protein [Anaerolineaceae bacterium]